MLTKLFEVYEVVRNKTWRTYRTEKECIDYLESGVPADYMSTLTLTIRPIWTNLSDQDIKKLLKE